MDTTFAKIENPYGIEFHLSAGTDGVIGGTISMNGIQHYLPVVSKDILDLLSKLSNRYLFDSLINDMSIIPNSVNDLPESVKTVSLEIKCKLIVFAQEMDGEKKVKLEKIQLWYISVKEDEARRHKDTLYELERRYKSELLNIEGV